MESAVNIFTPSEKLNVKKTGIISEAFLISAICSSEYPVVAITTGREEDKAKSSREERLSALEKSIITSGFSLTLSKSP